MNKYEAEAATKRVAGVVAVANDLEVRMPAVDERPDPDIARDAVAALKFQLPVSWENIKIVVKNGWLTLEGEVQWQYQRQTAEIAVRRIKGVKGVSNTILLRPHIEPSEVKRKIEEALRRSAEVDASRITVEANGGEVVLKGTVRSWIEREEAERAAWAASRCRSLDRRTASTRARSAASADLRLVLRGHRQAPRGGRPWVLPRKNGFIKLYDAGFGPGPT